MTTIYTFQVLKEIFLAGGKACASELRPQIGKSRESINTALRQMAYMLDHDDMGPRATRRWWMREECRAEMEAFNPVAKMQSGVKKRNEEAHQRVLQNVEAVFAWIDEHGPVSREEAMEALSIDEKSMQLVFRSLRGRRGEAKRVYIADHRCIDGSTQKQTPLYCAGDHPDVPKKRKGDMDAEELLMLETSSKRAKWLKDFKPRRDIASAWF